ncbi:MAG: hypothetical protein GY757_47585 [bacterium]|nr:hypothetical protein [bacterium]
MKKVIMILVVLMFSLTMFAGKVATLGEVLKPVTISVDSTQLYVTEGATVFIYSLKDYKFVKKFGRKGEGPKEFNVGRLPIIIDVTGDDIFINSLGKVSYYSKDGIFKKEQKLSLQAFFLQPVGGPFLGRSQAFDNGKVYNTINLYDSELKNKVKEVWRGDSGYKGQGKGVQLLGTEPNSQYQDNKIFLPGKGESIVDVFDENMKKVLSIGMDTKRIKVSREFKDEAIKYLKKSPSTKDFYEAVYKPVSFPEYFPNCRTFFTLENKLYIMTYNREEDGEKVKNEFYIYDMKGMLLKKKWISIKYQSYLEPYPITMKNGKLYQLVENLDEEEWDLYIEDMK